MKVVTLTTKDLENRIQQLNRDARIDELKKVKNEMLDFDIESTNGNNPRQVFLLTRDLMISIVNQHIAELKGENK